MKPIFWKWKKDKTWNEGFLTELEQGLVNIKTSRYRDDGFIVDANEIEIKFKSQEPSNG